MHYILHTVDQNKIKEKKKTMDFLGGKLKKNGPHMFCSLVVGRAACICTQNMGESLSAHIHLVRMCLSCKFSDLRWF